jgi:hypothetical protein
MNPNRSQDRHPRQQAYTRLPDELQQDLNPNRATFTLRKQGGQLGRLDDNDRL